MKPIAPKPVTSIALATCAIISLALSAVRAETIFDDAFDRTGPLAKTGPEPANGPGAFWGDNAVIAGSSGFRTENGSLVISNISNFVFLPFNFSYIPEKSVLSLSAIVTFASGSGRAWIALGFADGNNIFRGGTAWFRIGTNGKYELVKGPGHAGSPRVSPPAPLTQNKAAELKITYDTSTNIATFSVDGETAGTIPFDSMPRLDRVFFASIADDGDSLGGTVDNFKFEVAPAE